jgi:hypothetical protein
MLTLKIKKENRPLSTFLDSRYPACAGTGSAGMTVAMDSRYPACAGTCFAGMTVAGALHVLVHTD